MEYRLVDPENTLVLFQNESGAPSFWWLNLINDGTGKMQKRRNKVTDWQDA